MERKLGLKEEMMQSTNISINGNDDDDDVSPKQDIDDESIDFKKEISCHSLYTFLVDSHLDCLKMCLGNNDSVITPTALPSQLLNCFAANKSELDRFMEAYCETLKKLKEVMEEPQKESMAFINFMYSQLDDLPSSRD